MSQLNLRKNSQEIGPILRKSTKPNPFPTEIIGPEFPRATYVITKIYPVQGMVGEV